MHSLCGELELVDPPAIEPVSRAEAKRHCRVESPDEDREFDGWIATAREVCEERLARSLVTTTWDLLLPGFPSASGGGLFHPGAVEVVPQIPGSGRRIYLPRPPLQSITSVSYYDAGNTLQTLSSDNYTLVKPYKGLGYLERLFWRVWPVTYTRSDAVRVRFVAGYGAAAADVPERIRHAIKLLVGHYYENREEVIAGAPLRSIARGVEDLLSSADYSRAGG